MTNKFFITRKFDDKLAEMLPDLEEAIEKQARLRDGEIELYIDSLGGSAYVLKSFLTLIEQAQLNEVSVRTLVMGSAGSAGSLLAAAGTPGHRYISRHGSHRIHYGATSSYVTNPDEAEDAAGWYAQHFEWVIGRYLENSKFTRKKLDKLLRSEYTSLSAEESIKYGLADHITGLTKESK